MVFGENYGTGASCAARAGDQANRLPAIEPDQPAGAVQSAEVDQFDHFTRE
jgi:hypothetical protein